MARAKRNKSGRFVKKSRAPKRRTGTKKKKSAGRVSRPAKRRTRTRASSKGASTMAKKKSTGGRRRTTSRLLGGLTGGDLKDVGVQTAAMIGTSLLVDKLPVAQLTATPGGRIAGKALIAVAGGVLLRRFAGAGVAKSFMKGGLMAAAADAYAMTLAPRGVAGGIPYGYESMSGMGYLPSGGDTEDELSQIMAGVDASYAA